MHLALSPGPSTAPTTAIAYNAVNELLTSTLYNGAGQQVNQASWYYDAAGNQTGNSGHPGTSQPLTITDNQHDQTTSITDVDQHPVAMTWTGAGQAERTSADWSNQPSPPTGQPAEFGHTTYSYSALGLMSRADTTGTSYYTYDPSGLPVSERTPAGTYYYVFDGQGNVVMLVDAPSGDPVAISAPCPTGNQPDNQWQAPGTHALDELPQQYGGAFGVVTDQGTGNLKFASSFSGSSGTGPTQRNCDDPLGIEQLFCVLPTPGSCFGPFGCTIVPGILKAFCDLGGGIFCSPDEAEEVAGASRCRRSR